MRDLRIRSYKIPIRPDVSWAIQQENDKLTAVLKEDAKWTVKGKPGNWNSKWKDGLGATPEVGPEPTI